MSCLIVSALWVAALIWITWDWWRQSKRMAKVIDRLNYIAHVYESRMGIRNGIHDDSVE